MTCKFAHCYFCTGMNDVWRLISGYQHATCLWSYCVSVSDDNEFVTIEAQWPHGHGDGVTWEWAVDHWPVVRGIQYIIFVGSLMNFVINSRFVANSQWPLCGVTIMQHIIGHIGKWRLLYGMSFACIDSLKNLSGICFCACVCDVCACWWSQYHF